MLHRALRGVALDTGSSGSTPDPVHVCGDGCVVPTAETGQMDPIFAWEVLFACCVCDGWGGSKERVWGESVYCTSSDGGVDMGAEGGIKGEGWEGAQGVLVEASGGSVGRAGSRATGGGMAEVV